MNFGVWHNGTTDLPLKETDDGLVVPDATFKEMNDDRRRVTKDRINHGILADKLGYDRLTFTEHHFVVTGAEHSPNPLLSQAVIASHTNDIILRQVANIITWHEPIRLAEQIAMLDIISDGRVEVGIGRGYQPRENEVLGQYWGGGIGDQEQNRTSFEEKYEILIAAWTEDFMSYHGEFHHIPPSWTKWHHPQERAYLDEVVKKYTSEDMIDWAEGSVDETSINPIYPNVVAEGSSKLRSISVFPKPIQQPYPQLWQPVGSPRSIQYAAERGINPYLAGARDPAEITRTVDTYYEAAESADWPDRRPEYDGDPFDRPWDESRQRGLTIYVPVFNTEIAPDETYHRWLQGIKFYWQFIGFFGLAAGLPTEADEHPIDLIRTLDPERLVDQDLYLAGDTDYLCDHLAKLAEKLGSEAICVDLSFEAPGITSDEAEHQLEYFSESIMPYFQEQART